MNSILTRLKTDFKHNDGANVSGVHFIPYKRFNYLSNHRSTPQLLVNRHQNYRESGLRTEVAGKLKVERSNCYSVPFDSLLNLLEATPRLMIESEVRQQLQPRQEGSHCAKEGQLQETRDCSSVEFIQLIARQLKRALPEFPTGIQGATQYGRTKSIHGDEATPDLIPRKAMQIESTMLRGEQNIDHGQEKHHAASQECNVVPQNHQDTVAKDLRIDHTVSTTTDIHLSSRDRLRGVEIGRKVIVAENHRDMAAPLTITTVAAIHRTIEAENHRDSAAPLTITTAAAIHRIITFQGKDVIKKVIRRYIQAMIQGMIGSQPTEPGRRDEFHQQIA